MVSHTISSRQVDTVAPPQTLFFDLNSLTDKNNILQRVSDPMALAKAWALLLVHSEFMALVPVVDTE